MKLVGYQLWSPTGRGHFFGDDWRRYCCAVCHRVVRRYRPRIVVLKDYYDYCSTYDCRDIVSDRFRRFCQSHRIPGAKFVEVNRRRKLYWLVATRRIKFPRNSHGVSAGRRCARCGQETWFTDFPSVLPRRRRPLGRGFWRSDLLFGDRYSASPVLLVDPMSARRLRAAGFKGLKLAEVRGDIIG